jgi:hypothetical protein
MYFRSFSALLVGALSTSVLAVDVIWELGIEAQAFSKDGAPQTHREGVALSFQPSLTHEFESNEILFTFEPFLRWDQHEEERNHVDIRELKAIKVFNDWELEAGISKVFWGVAETNHLVDIINQTDFLEGIDGEDKLGQPMLSASRIFDQSSLSLFVLPYFRERDFFGPESRLALPFPVKENQAQYESSDEEKHIDYALRYSGYAGQMDYGLSWFDGTARDAQLRPQTPAAIAFLPFYAQIEQLGLDVQYTADAWLWKLEAIHQQSTQEDFSATVAGLEYTIFSLKEGMYDLGLLAEFNHDSRDDAQTVLLQNDLFIGTRASFNDAESSAILAGMFIDLDDDSQVFRVEASRRVFGNASLSIEAQIFSNTDPGNIGFAFRDNDFLELELAWFF